MTLLEHDFIVANASKRQDRAAVYFLVKDHVVVYVGASRKNVFARIARHIRDEPKPFTHYYAVYCDRKDLNAVEAAYIDAFKPLYNNAGNTGYSAAKHADAILATVGLSTSALSS